MTLDIVFGIVETHKDDDEGEEYPWVVWPGLTGIDDPREEDGTDPDLSISWGRPMRYLSWGGVSEYLHDFPEVRAVLVAAGYNGSNDYCYTHLTPPVMRLIEAIPTDRGAAVERDRAVWFRYWARRAKEAFGEAAVIGIR